MPMTRQEADTKLHEAIVAHAEAHGLQRDNEMLGDYALVAAWQSMGDGERYTRYTTHCHVWDAPQHIVLGLFEVGLEMALIDGADE